MQTILSIRYFSNFPSECEWRDPCERLIQQARAHSTGPDAAGAARASGGTMSAQPVAVPALPTTANDGSVLTAMTATMKKAAPSVFEERGPRDYKYTQEISQMVRPSPRCPTQRPSAVADVCLRRDPGSHPGDGQPRRGHRAQPDHRAGASACVLSSPAPTDDMQIIQARALATRRGARYLSAEDLIFLIRHDRGKVNRLRTYLSWKDVRKHAKDSGGDGGGGAEVEALDEGDGRSLVYTCLS